MVSMRNVATVLLLLIMSFTIATSQCRSHLQSGLASGLEKLAPCRLIGVRGKTSDEGFMGARPSTGRGSARWFLFPTNTWEPPLLTWVV